MQEIVSWRTIEDGGSYEGAHTCNGGEIVIEYPPVSVWTFFENMMSVQHQPQSKNIFSDKINSRQVNCNEKRCYSKRGRATK